MIVDKNGRMFEDRRKNNSDRRTVDIDTTGGRRIEDRRKADNKIKEKAEKENKRKKKNK